MSESRIESLRKALNAPSKQDSGPLDWRDLELASWLEEHGEWLYSHLHNSEMLIEEVTKWLADVDDALSDDPGGHDADVRIGARWNDHDANIRAALRASLNYQIKENNGAHN